MLASLLKVLKVPSISRFCRLNTDIHFGRNCGFQTLCVLTGITSQSALQQAESDGNKNFIPDYFSDDVSYSNPFVIVWFGHENPFAESYLGGSIN